MPPTKLLSTVRNLLAYIFIASYHPMIRPRLPPELMDMIIDFLHDDVQSLLTCALVCRAWLPSCRFHLFHHSTISTPSRFESAFHTIATTPDVSIYIFQLTIIGQREGFSFAMLDTLLRGLPHLQRLFLQNVRFQKRSTRGSRCRNTAARLLQHPQEPEHPQQHGRFALEELRLLDCNATMANYDQLFYILRLFSSIKTLFLSSVRHARTDYSKYQFSQWVFTNRMGCVEVQHLHTSNIPPSVVEVLLTTSRAIHQHGLQTFWYDEDVLDWVPRKRRGELGEMLASLPSRRNLPCLILGPLAILEDVFEMQHGLARLPQLGSMRGLHTFHLRGRWLEPHLADIFAVLPDTVRDVRFVMVGNPSSGGSWEGSRNRFRAFAEAFAPVLTSPQRAQMSFILDLGVAKMELSEEDFAALRKRAETGLLGHRLVGEGRMRIDDSRILREQL